MGKGENKGAKIVAVGGGIAAAAGLVLANAGNEVAAASEEKLDDIQAKQQHVDKDKTPQTAAALEEEKTKAASALIRGKTAEGWGLAGLGLGTAATVLALRRLGKKPGGSDIGPDFVQCAKEEAERAKAKARYRCYYADSKPDNGPDDKSRG